MLHCRGARRRFVSAVATRSTRPRRTRLGDCGWRSGSSSPEDEDGRRWRDGAGPSTASSWRMRKTTSSVTQSNLRGADQGIVLAGGHVLATAEGPRPRFEDRRRRASQHANGFEKPTTDGVLVVTKALWSGGAAFLRPGGLAGRLGGRYCACLPRRGEDQFDITLIRGGNTGRPASSPRPSWPSRSPSKNCARP